MFSVIEKSGVRLSLATPASHAEPSPFAIVPAANENHVPCSWGAPVPSALREMVEECWAPDFEARPSFPALIKRLEDALKTLPANPPAAGGRGAAPAPGKGCCAVQ